MFQLSECELFLSLRYSPSRIIRSNFFLNLQYSFIRHKKRIHKTLVKNNVLFFLFRQKSKCFSAMATTNCSYTDSSNNYQVLTCASNEFCCTGSSLNTCSSTICSTSASSSSSSSISPTL